MWTLDEETRRRYVRGMTQLSVWYVRVLLERGEIRAEDVPAALCRRVDLYRMTDFWDGHSASSDGMGDVRWMETVDQIAGWIRASPPAETDGLEQRVLAILEPSLEARLPRDVGPPPVRPFGCWTYDLGWAGLADGRGVLGKLTNRSHLTAVLRSGLGLAPLPSRDGVLHIMNVRVPRSPFEDMPELALTLRRLIAEIRAEHPQVRELWCNTWLNEHPKFHDLFPETWFRSGTVSPPGNYRNWWGQFARRDGDFNERLALRFRESRGVFPFRALLCHAGIEEIEAHLAARSGA